MNYIRNHDIIYVFGSFTRNVGKQIVITECWRGNFAPGGEAREGGGGGGDGLGGAKQQNTKYLSDPV